MKECSKCKERKSTEEFYKVSRSSDKVRGVCKVCTYIQNKDSGEAWVKQNPEKRALTHKLQREKNRETRNAYSREYLKRWRLENKQKIKDYVTNNASTVNAYNAKRRAIKLKRTPNWLIEEDYKKIQDYYQVAKMLEEVTGVKYHVDHIVPLQGENVSGLHCPDNLQVIPASENLAKYNKFEV